MISHVAHPSPEEYNKGNVVNLATKRHGSQGPPGPPSDGPPPDEMTEPRIDALEKRFTTLEGEHRTHFRWTIGTLLAAAGLLLTTTLTTAFFLFGRIDRADDKLARLHERVTELPGKLSQNLLDVNRTLSEAITAARQQPAQVILIPAPTVTQTPQPPPR